VSLVALATGNEPTGRLVNEGSSDEDDQGTDNLEEGGETPRPIRGHVGRDDTVGGPRGDDGTDLRGGKGSVSTGKEGGKR
jgi:hypothetical protein